MEGDERVCFLNGQQGTQTCGPDARFGPCEVPPPPPPPSGWIRPKYKIVTVLYSPPGKTGGGSSSAVSYASGSTTGTTTTSSHGFKQSYSIEASSEFNVLLHPSASLSFSYGRNSVDTTAMDVVKTGSSTLGQAGPSADGIDHDRDQIWLWLSPTVDVVLPTPTSIEWAFDPSATMNLQFVYVGWLKDPSQIPPGTKAQLDAAHLTTADYAQILLADPFASGGTTIDPNRFAALNTTFPYEPPFAPGDPSPTLNFTATHTNTSTVTNATTNEYTLGLTASIGGGIGDLIKASLKTTDSWTWTDMHSRAEAIGSTESASVTIGGPSFGYTGPTDIAVYYDLVYKTFAFAFVQTPPLQGVLFSRSNAPVGNQEVVVEVGGVTYHSFTNPYGEFRVFGPRAGVVQLHAAGAAAVPVSLSHDPVVIAVP
jgi:hypothetical protein